MKCEGAPAILETCAIISGSRAIRGAECEAVKFALFDPFPRLRIYNVSCEIFAGA